MGVSVQDLVVTPKNLNLIHLQDIRTDTTPERGRSRPRNQPRRPRLSDITMFKHQ